jgi:hypothetical protein
MYLQKAGGNLTSKCASLRFTCNRQTLRKVPKHSLFPIESVKHNPRFERLLTPMRHDLGREGGKSVLSLVQRASLPSQVLEETDKGFLEGVVVLPV